MIQRILSERADFQTDVFDTNIIPGYGRCQSHGEMSEASWDRQRKALIGRIECGTLPTCSRTCLDPNGPAVTDVAGEMDALTDTFADCKACHKACTAAVEMLAVRDFSISVLLGLTYETNSINANGSLAEWMKFRMSIDYSMG